MRECRCWNKAETESVFVGAGKAEPMGKGNLPAHYVFRLDLALSSGVFTTRNSRKKKVLFLWIITFSHHVT